MSRKFFSLEDVAGNDDPVKLYTGFTTYSVFLAFYKFLGPSTTNLPTEEFQSVHRNDNVDESLTR